MNVFLPDDLVQAARHGEAELRQELALLLYAQERLTLAQAARLADMPRFRFQHLTASRGLTIHYDVPELEKDLENLRRSGSP
jgi:predicted HTH domain antitoxin